MTDMPESEFEPNEPEVMFLPLAVLAAPWPVEGTRLDANVVARRIPDFVHQVLNQGQAGPTAMLELQSTSEAGPVTWVQMEATPEHDDAFDLLPPDLEVRAVVAGSVACVEGALRVEFHVFRDEDGDESVTEKIGGTVHFADPVAGLLRLTRHLARLLGIVFHEPPRGLLTSKGAAFWHFLEGLDNAMLLSGDLEIAVPDDREALIRPFADALAIDPSFGLALRVANATTAIALDGSKLDQEAVRRFLDRCYSAEPHDGEACVAVAEQLSDMGDDQRALAWLQHATHLEPPPARGLENLGMMMARRGDIAAARELWEKGLELDGHPDFCSHLAQLGFAEHKDAEAWELELRGLRRMRERTVRAGEWDDVDRGAGILLECLHAVLSMRAPAPGIDQALVQLRSLLVGEDRVFLGLCLLACGLRKEARTELVGGLRDSSLALDVRDRAVRALLQLDVTDFEARFAKAADQAQRGRNPRACFGEFQLMLQLQTEFWPALFFSAVAKRRLGSADEALDLLARAISVSPGQPDVLYEMAELFAARQNSKRALELIEEALDERPKEARFHAARARYLKLLGRLREAKACVDAALAEGLGGRELRKIRRALR